MKDSTKSFFTGLLGLIAGILLTALGVQEINKRVINFAEEIGKKKAEFERDELEIARLRDSAVEASDSIKELREASSNTLKALEEEKIRLLLLSSQISDLVHQVTDLSEDEATKQLELLSSLAQGLKSDDAVTRLHKL